MGRRPKPDEVSDVRLKPAKAAQHAGLRKLAKKAA
jgi:hypothetical protein